MNSLAFIGTGALVVCWALVFHFQLIDTFLFPGPWSVFIESFRLFRSGDFISDLCTTLSREVMALGIALLFGLPLGLLLGVKPKIYKSWEFVIDFFRSIPATAMFPIFLLIFGVTDKSKIAVAAFAATLIVVFHTANGVMHTSKVRSQAIRLMGANAYQVFKWLLLWESLPQTLSGMRSAVSLSLVVVVVTEMFIGTKVGLGRKIIDSQITYNLDTMYAAILLTGVIGYALNYFFIILEKRFLHWTSK